MITQTAAYIVPFDTLKRAVGSRDRQLLQAIIEECASLLNEADKNRPNKDSPTCAQALADLIHGIDFDGFDPSKGNSYGLAFETMCAHFGEFVGEVHGHWNDLMDAYFAECGVPLKYSDLVIGEEVIDLPIYADYPEVGSWSPSAVLAAVAPLNALNLEALRENDEELAEVVGEITQWIQRACKMPGWGIVGFSL